MLILIHLFWNGTSVCVGLSPSDIKGLTWIAFFVTGRVIACQSTAPRLYLLQFHSAQLFVNRLNKQRGTKYFIDQNVCWFGQRLHASSSENRGSWKSNQTLVTTWSISWNAGSREHFKRQTSPRKASFLHLKFTTNFPSHDIANSRPFLVTLRFFVFRNFVTETFVMKHKVKNVQPLKRLVK